MPEITVEIKPTNGGKNYDDYIKKIKEWTQKNFFFHHGVVAYATHSGELDKLSPLPEGLVEESKMIYDTKVFDTPFSHLIFTLLLIGEKKESDEAQKMLNELCESFKI